MCLFIGAGFSLYAGYPSGDQLAKIIFNNLSEEERKQVLENSGLSKLAQDFVTLKGGSRDGLISILKKEFLKKPTDTYNHDVLSRISFFKTILTTNYDTLIEDSYTNKAIVISKPIDISIPNQNKVKIYKIHGDINDSKSIIITSKDYSNLYGVDCRNLFWASIISELASKHVIFLGYGYEDLNIWSIFEEILKFTKGKGTKRFFISPIISPLKEAHLKQSDITFFKITGEQFLNDLTENIKINLKKDVENNYVSVDTALKVFTSHNLKVQIDKTPNKTSVTSIQKASGVTSQLIKFQISDKKAIEKYKKFCSNNGGINLTLNHNQLADFEYSIEGFNFTGLDNLAKITIQKVPIFSQTCSIQFIENGFEIENINYFIYNIEKNKLLIKTEIESFELEIYMDLTNNPTYNLKIKIFEPKVITSINKAIKIYNLTYLLFKGKLFNLLFQNGTSLLNKSFNNIKKGTYSFDDELRFYKALKRIELHFNVKFKDIQVSDLDKNVPFINDMINLIERNRLIVDEGEGLLFEANTVDIKLINSIKKLIVNNQGVMSFIHHNHNVNILGQNFDLGERQVIIAEPYIAEQTNNSVKIRSKSGKIIFCYAKFGFKEIKHSTLIS